MTISPEVKEAYRNVAINGDSISTLMTVLENEYGVIDVCQGLKYALKNEVKDLVEVCIYLGAKLNENYECIETLNELMISDFHIKHEDVALLLTKYGNDSSVPYLQKAAMIQFEYLDFDDSFALGVKCVRAISAIGGESARSSLTQLAKSENVIVSKKSMELLNKNF